MHLTGIPTITILCGGQSILDWKAQIQGKTTINPQDTIADDYDICKEIIQTINNLKPYPVKLVHVKGHQDHYWNNDQHSQNDLT